MKVKINQMMGFVTVWKKFPANTIYPIYYNFVLYRKHLLIS